MAVSWSTKFVQPAATRSWQGAGEKTASGVGNEPAEIKLEVKPTAGNC